jgi:hypothetical protein
LLPDWDPPLEHRKGGPSRLLGIDVYHDFRWTDLLPDERAQFRNGQCLARLAINDCPTGKRPALLLTTRSDVAETPLETDSQFFLVVNLPRYLSQATNDAAASYYAHQLHSGITGIARLGELASSPDVVRAVLDKHLDLAEIARWAGNSVERLEQLRELAGKDDQASSADLPSIARAIRAVEMLDHLDSELITAVQALLRGSDRTARLAFLSALTADEDGRLVTSEALGERIADRLDDIRTASTNFASLLRDPVAGETALQNFIEQHPWLLGLDYVCVRARRAIPRGTVDFLLERFDGYHDLLELKDPQDPIIEAPPPKDGVPPPASSYRLSLSLAQALAQIHVYRDVLTDDSGTVEKLYGLQETRDPLLIVVIGQVAGLTTDKARVLKNLNLSLHRVEIVPYDVLGTRAQTVVKNVERYLTERAST